MLNASTVYGNVMSGTTIGDPDVMSDTTIGDPDMMSDNTLVTPTRNKHT
jgi:hypothetical protein